MSFNEKHPTIPHKPIVDFNIAILFNPCMMLGTFIGVILQVTFPGIVSMILLLITLITATMTGAKNAKKKYIAESKAIEEEEKKKSELNQGLINNNEPKEMATLQVPGGSPPPRDDKHEHYDDQLNEEENEKRLEAIERISQTEADNFPWEKMKLVFGSFFLTCLAPILLGGKAMDSFLGITICSVSYWTGSVLYLAAVIYLWYKAFNMVLDETEQKKNVAGGWPFIEIVKWERNYIIKMSIFMTGVGMFSAIVGVGGGIYIVPTLQEMGFPNTVISATSLFLVFWAKLASTF